MSSTNLDELTKDLEEFQRLATSATRPRAQKVLNNEIQRIQKEIDNFNKPQTVISGGGVGTVLPTTKISTYAWDQSEKYVKLYVTIPGAVSGKQYNIKFDAQARSVDLYANDVAGKNYYFNVKGLLHSISPDDSEFKVKTDQILLMLKKTDAGRSWMCVTEVEARNLEKNKPKMDDPSDPNAGMMKMMKQMYDEGDDEVKRNINKAWSEAQEKKKDGLGDGTPMGFM